MEEYSEAQQPEILHQINKDREMLGTLNSKILSGLELFISPKHLYKNRKTLMILGSFFYYMMNSYRLKQTLGEEYSYIRQFNKKDYVYLSKRRMLLFAFLSSSGYFLLEKLAKKIDQFKLKKINFLESEFEKIGKMGREEKLKKLKKMKNFTEKLKFFSYEFLKNFGDFENFYNNVILLNLSLFYIKGKFPTVIKRILGIEYKAVVKMKPHAFTYEKVGYVILVKLGLSFLKYFYQSIKGGLERKKDIIEALNAQEEERSEENEEHNLEGGKCGVCFDTRQNCSVTPCGHLYCHDCIIKSLGYREECPQCRVKVKLEEIIELKNFH